ncbi:hypothetical protein APHAL10511_008034 [Amanita phalloides]|nr:hypothetical protein APHAL10511_008034 [Amanita phalloides]
MSFPLTLSTPGPAASFTLPKKRLRDLSGEDIHDLDVSTQDKRKKQLKIEIPPTSLSYDSWSSICSTAPVKGSPSPLFSAASEVDSLFDQASPVPHSRSATSHVLNTSTTVSIKDSPTSLFSAMSEVDSLFDGVPSVHRAGSATSLPTISDRSVLYPALLTAPPIQGLYFDPSLCLPQQVAESVMNFCLDTYFRRPGVNQVMLFGRAPSLEDSPSAVHGLPTVLLDLLSTLSILLRPFLPEPTYTLLFPPTPTRARQAIINLYNPGEGISPHIDLLKRYGDGIIGVSLGSGCVMRFDRAGGAPAGADHHHGYEEQQGGQRNRWDLYLPVRSVLVLSEAARYEWTHGIDKRTRDFVSGAGYDDGVDKMCLDHDRSISMAGRWIERSVRLSVTFRWLLPGADVVGPPASN